LKTDLDLKQKVAVEAATLLYFGAEKEYKQAKDKAAETYGSHFLPSNRQIALELDRIAAETEGSSRETRLVEMRREALRVMKLLGMFCPLLIGSVWRGNIRRGSDIDIAVYTDNPEEVVGILKEAKVKVARTQWERVNKQGETLASLHIYAETTFGIEIVARAASESAQKRKCEIFGDTIKGLKLNELGRLLESNPTQRFLPA
jgi:predicted nucleotidyltransferase